MEHTDQIRLELTIFGEAGQMVAIARRGADVAIRNFKMASKLPELKAFRQRVVDQLRGNGAVDKLTGDQVEEFGRRLFDLIVNGDIRDLYNRLTAAGQIGEAAPVHYSGTPADRISLQLTSPTRASYRIEYFDSSGTPSTPDEVVVQAPPG